MKPPGRLLPLLCVLAASLALPVTASADFVVSGGQSVEAHLAGTHGYHLTIFGATSGGVFVSAQKGASSVLYFPKHAMVQRDRVKAWLPGIGRVFLRFREQERGHEEQSKFCHGPAPIVRRGVFTGWVLIRGERNYTRAESRHVRGKIVRSFRRSCHLPARARASTGGAVQQLEATAPRRHGLLNFSAIAFPSISEGSPRLLRAALIRQRGSMLVANSITVVTKRAESLAVATPPRSASVDPPRPFTGSATFQQESDEDFSWTGDLAVELPGAGEVSLAGSKFESSLCIGRHCRGDLDQSGTSFTIAAPRATAPTPSPWRWPDSPR